VYVNEQNAPVGSTFGGEMFLDLGSYAITQNGNLRIVLANNTNGFVVADAVRVTPSTS
jgi:hypothetical protein